MYTGIDILEVFVIADECDDESDKFDKLIEIMNQM